MDNELDHITNPPLIGVRDEDVLCPPTEPAAYMKWLVENREKLKAFFGFDPPDPLCPHNLDSRLCPECERDYREREMEQLDRDGQL